MDSVEDSSQCPCALVKLCYLFLDFLGTHYESCRPTAFSREMWMYFSYLDLGVEQAVYFLEILWVHGVEYRSKMESGAY